jgi:gamma-aminobutyric acid type B receptor
MAIVGSCLIYGAVILLGVDHATLSHDTGFPFVCMVRLFSYYISQESHQTFGIVSHSSFTIFIFFCVVHQGRAYFLSAGFSLAFGAMFTKTFRVHRIFSMRNSLLKNKVIQILGILCIIYLCKIAKRCYKYQNP